MEPYYEVLSWEVNVQLIVNPDFISVSTEYQFANTSEDESFYFGLLPRFLAIPPRSLINGKKILIEAIIIDSAKNQTLIFNEEKRAEGINVRTECYMPIPWTSIPGKIPPGNFLKIKYSWLERGPDISDLNGCKNWATEYFLPLSKLFLPLELHGKSAVKNYVPSCDSINIEIQYPEGTSFVNTPKSLTCKPTPKSFIPSISHHTDTNPSIRISFQPLPDKPFSDFTFTFPVDLNVPIELEEIVFNKSLEQLRNYTSEVIVAIVDLKGSSPIAEEHRDNPNPINYTLNFQKLAREYFPPCLSSSYAGEPPVIKMKKIIGDMLMLVASSENSSEIVSRTLSFINRLNSESIPFRAGFHVDQATNTGNSIHSLNEQGTDFLGPAINWVAKIGDDKNNSGIRITKPAVEKVKNVLGHRYEFVSIGFHEKKSDLEIFDLKEIDIASTATSISELFSTKLNNRILDLDSRVCVGLDPDLSRFPQSLLKKYNLENVATLPFDDLDLDDVAECITSFNKIIIDAVCHDAVAVKPQSAHYERYGHQGILALEESVKYAKSKGLVVILDAKRNDIGSTATKYALAYLGYDCKVDKCAIPFDAITVNPYLGTDGIIPFTRSCKENGKGIFILVKTSNKSSGDLQDLKLEDGQPLSHELARMLDEWGREVVNTEGFSSVGAVVGATYPDDIKNLRKIMPQAIFLIPGYGAQGAKADNISAAFDDKGFGAIVNSSRDIIYCYSPEDTEFQEKIKEKAIYMKNDINSLFHR